MHNPPCCRHPWGTWTMLEPICVKRSVRPHSYTLTSKKSLASPTSDYERFYCITRTVWTVGQAEGRGANLPNMASVDSAILHTNMNDAMIPAQSSRQHAELIVNAITHEPPIRCRKQCVYELLKLGNRVAFLPAFFQILNGEWHDEKPLGFRSA
jgi:hypothetical protein